MADGYGAGLFDSKGPKDFADAIGGISTKLSTVSDSFGSFGTAASTSLANISNAVDNLVNKLQGLSGQITQLGQAVPTGGGGGGGGRWSGRRGPGSTSPGGGSGQTGANVNAQGWTPGDASTPDAKTGAAPPLAGMEQETAQGNRSTMGQPMQQGSAQQGNQPGWDWTRASQALIPAAVGAVGNAMGGQGAVGGLMTAAVQGATIGAITAPAFGVSPRSQYVIPNGILAQNAGDYAQSNYEAMMSLYAAPGTQNWSQVQGGANQMMALVPGMTRQGAMGAMGQMMSNQTLNAGLMFGMNFRPGGQIQTPQQIYEQIWSRMFMGTAGPTTGQQFMAYMQGPGQANLTALGMGPGTEQYQGFMDYALTKLGTPGGKMPDLSTVSGIKQTALGKNPYFSQLSAQSAAAQVQSQAEPDLAAAASSLNQAAAALLRAVDPLASLFGSSGIGGAVGGTLGGIGMIGGGVMAARALPTLGKMATKLPGIRGVTRAAGGWLSGRGGMLGKLGGLFGRGGGEAAGAEAGTEAAVGGLEGAGVAADATGVGLPVGLALGAAGLGVGLLAPHIGSIWHGLFGGGHKKPTSSTSGTDPGTADSGMMAALQGQAPTNSVMDYLTRQVKTSDKTLISYLTSPMPTATTPKAGGATNATLAMALTGGAGGSPAALSQSAISALGGAGNPAVANLLSVLSGSGGSAWNYNAPGGGPANMMSVFGYQTGQGTSSNNGGAPSAGTSTATTNLTGSSNAQKAYNFFLSKGLKDYQAAAIIGNLAQESNVNPSESGGGLAQWGGSRWSALQAFAKQQKKSVNDLGVQLDFMWSELTGTESAALQALQGTTNVTSATEVFSNDYERPGTPDMSNRIAYAQKALQSKGASYARGSQYIARTQLALLHAGEAVVPAADNYSATPYNRGGASNGGGTTVHLNFKAGAVVLQVPPGSTQQDMDNLANQFVAAISKPQVLAAVRST
jgi:hypothetical protein